ncbi:MAG: EthD family reductase [Acidimicrobiales bacterium]
MSSLIEVRGDHGVFAETPDVFKARVTARRLAEMADVRSVAVHLGDADAPNVVRATGPVHVLLDELFDLPEVVLSETRSRYLRRHRIRWRPGDPTPGVSVLYRVPRHPDLSIAAFNEHWEDGHGPLALDHHLGMWDYEQIAVVDSQSTDAPDGIAVVGFPCLADFKDRFFDGPEGAAVIRADAAAFTDGPRVRRQLTTEQVMKFPPVPSEAFHVGDHRQLELTADPADVWELIGDFGSPPDWGPGAPLGLETVAGDDRIRRLTRADGSQLTESLIMHNSDERMLQLEVTDGLPSGISGYTWRFEVRAVPNGCRVDWDLRATVKPEVLILMAGIADEAWRAIQAGLGARFEVTPPGMGGTVPFPVPDEPSAQP